jgi:2-keto-3-deoxy-6-phosphogluconate aldolase
VTAETAPDFIRAGAIAVGLGSWLIGDGDLQGIVDRSETVVRAVEAARRPSTG